MIHVVQKKLETMAVTMQLHLEQCILPFIMIEDRTQVIECKILLEKLVAMFFAPKEVLNLGHCAVLEHLYLASSPAAESERTMLFYNEARVDGLTKREETSTSMVEHFSNREDFLYYMHTEFGAKPKKVGPKGEDANPRPILVRRQLDRWSC